MPLLMNKAKAFVLTILLIADGSFGVDAHVFL